jgi:hypothetical protein
MRKVDKRFLHCPLPPPQLGETRESASMFLARADRIGARSLKIVIAAERSASWERRLPKCIL